MRSVTLALLMWIVCRAAAQGTATLEVEVTLNKAAGGQLMLMLCPDSASYEAEEGCHLQKADAVGTVVKLAFTGLKPGTYALRAVHDINANGDIDVNKLGLPIEPFAFSNDAMGRMGPPGFNEATFAVRAGANSIKVKMRGGSK
ncbi:MAG: DUF2141 domain-containing protein [Flavobacteriales bacterium]|nr:MAG: DUF2141 domain-containing protein [Flavobacteriales bacterium]